LIEGAGFSLTKDENVVKFENDSLKCEPVVGSPGFAFDFTIGNFSGKANNGVFICLMDKLEDGINSTNAESTRIESVFVFFCIGWLKRLGGAAV